MSGARKYSSYCVRQVVGQTWRGRVAFAENSQLRVIVARGGQGNKSNVIDLAYNLEPNNSRHPQLDTMREQHTAKRVRGCGQFLLELLFRWAVRPSYLGSSGGGDRCRRIAGCPALGVLQSGYDMLPSTQTTTPVLARCNIQGVLQHSPSFSRATETCSTGTTTACPRFPGVPRWDV